MVGDALGDSMQQAPDGSKFLTANMDEYIMRYEKASCCIRPRDLYPDQPARTVTCRNLAGATGDMLRIRLPDGRRRRLLVREAARLQSFPEWFEFCGTDSSKFNQIGNAVPPLLSLSLAASIRNYLDSDKRLTIDEIVYKSIPTQMHLPLEVKEITEMDIPTIITDKKKPKELYRLFNEALFVLSKLGIPIEGLTNRQLEKMAMAFLSVIDVRETF